MDKDQLLGEFENGMDDALALALRRIMDQNGRPLRRDYNDQELFKVHARQWDDAQKLLAAYAADKSASQ